MSLCLYIVKVFQKKYKFVMKKIIVIMMTLVLSFILEESFAQYQYTGPDLSILQRSLQYRESKVNAANENLATLKSILVNLKAELNCDLVMQRWISNYSDSLVNLVEDQLEVGNPGIARDLALNLISSVQTDPMILKVKQINKEYREFKDLVYSKYVKGDITLSALDCWIDKNQSLNANSFKNQYNNHWIPTYRISNSLDLNDMCRYIKSKTSDETEYYKYACEYASMKNGSIEQEYYEIEYKLKIVSQRHLNEEVEYYNRILPYKRFDYPHFIIRLVKELSH